MKKTFRYSTFLALGAAFAFASFGDQFQDDLKAVRGQLGKVSVHSSPTFIRELIADAEKFLATYAADTNHLNDVEAIRNDIVGKCVRAGDHRYGLRHLDALLASKNANRRLTAYAYRARNVLGESHDFAAALKELEPAYADAEIVKRALGDLVAVGAEILVARGDIDGVLKYIEGKRAAIPGRDDIFDGAVAKVYDDFYRPQDAAKYLLDRGNRLRAFGYFYNGRVGGNAEYDAIGLKLARELVLEEANVQAYGYLWRVDPGFAEKNIDRMVLDEDGKVRKGACDALVGRPGSPFRQMFTDNQYFREIWGVPRIIRDGNYALGARAYGAYLKLLDLVKTEKPRFDLVWGGARSYLGIGDEAKAREAIRLGLSIEKLSAEEKYRLTMAEKMLDGFKAGEDASVAAAHDELSQPIAEKNRRKEFEAVAKAFAADGATAKLEYIARAYKRFVNVDLPKKVYKVGFSDRGIYGPEDWKAVAAIAVESDFDRSYGGGGLSFMTTDVASGDRGNAAEAGEKTRKYPTVLQVVCDEWGLHFLSTFYDKRARQFESGELDCGSYENYLAPGDGEPYMCIMQSMKTGRASVMNTMYNAPGHQRVDTKNPAHFRSDVFYTDGSVMAYTAFSWERFAERVPENGGEYDYESLFWGPVASAWNGAQSIHGRSTFGKLRFELTDAQRVRILKRLLFKAASYYNAEKGPYSTAESGIQSGCIDFWQDDRLGDPEFYESCLKPIVAELDAAAAKVKTGITDAEVKALCRDYLGRFLHIRYEVGELRAKYLREKL